MLYYLAEPITFIRRVKYYFYLQSRLYLDKRGLTWKSKNVIQQTDLKKWKKILAKNGSLIKSLNLEVDKRTIILKANKILNHHFYILGKDYYFQNQGAKKELAYNTINWHFDPSSGYFFPKNIWCRLVRKNIPAGVDIKYPWELSRCQHFTILGKAYYITKDEKYAVEYRNQILDWINNNPVRYGINWSNTMEVGIRITNWLVALLYFIGSPTIDDFFLNKVFVSVMEHGNHIRKNLENLQQYTSNHYIANIAGLFVLAALIPNNWRKSRWLNFASKELESEIVKQTYESGWHYEASTSYHRLVTEMFFYSFIIAKELKIPFSQNYSLRLKKMMSILGNISKPNGTIPQIGDNDSGRFLIFNYENHNDDLNVHYLIEAAKHHKELNFENSKDFLIPNYDAGQFLWKDKRIYLLLTAGPKGQGGNGGHAHNDVLSYELNVGGKDLIVDPGTFCYTGDPRERNRFRSVRNHNTLSWDNIEPCSLDRGLFRLPEEGALTVSRPTVNQGVSAISGIYEYAGRFHRRTVSVDKIKKIIKIEDICSHPKATIAFTIAPEVDLRFETTGFWLDNIWFLFEGISSFSEESTFYSPGYGVKQMTKRILGHLKGLESVHIIYY